jgi:lipoyl(octanoyl) transferase
MRQTDRDPVIRVGQLGLVSYDRALDLQLSLRQDLLENRDTDGSPGYLLLLEHPPVVTVGKRGDREDLSDRGWLESNAVDVFEIDRGGELTYHEPGQLVIYPIFDLKRLDLGVVDLIRGIAECIADVIEPFGLQGEYDADVPGVWLESTPIRRKIASVGMRVQRDVTTHGAALNVNNVMVGFSKIIPCGMPEAPMTSLDEQFDGETVALPQIQRSFLKAFRERFDLPLSNGSFELRR